MLEENIKQKCTKFALRGTDDFSGLHTGFRHLMISDFVYLIIYLVRIA